MFSVDNFYTFFRSHYGWNKQKVLTWVFSEHGSKCFYDLVDLTQGHHEKTIEERMSGGCIIHHDQEIFLCSSLDTYKTKRYQIKNKSFWLDSIPAEDIIIQHVRTVSWPIFCHSEIGSTDIDVLEQHGFIPCYYFWHGLIARDWFRHWKHHADLQQTNLSWKKRFLLYARDHEGSRIYRKQIVKELEPLKDQILYNWESKTLIPSDYSATISVADARDTAIHLVAETVFDLGRIHATEKIFKPMVMRQPFIVFAGAGMLEYLRRYGFKTFHDVWDESYDQEIDHNVRMSRILDLIRRLDALSQDDFKKLMLKCQPILEHNRRHFFSQQFEDHLLSELDNNVRHALEIQKQRAQDDPGGSYFSFFKKYCVGREDYPKLPLESERMINLLRFLSEKDPERLKNILNQHPWAVEFCQ